MEIGLVCCWEGRKGTSVHGAVAGLWEMWTERERYVYEGQTLELCILADESNYSSWSDQEFPALKILKIILTPRRGRCCSKGKI